MDHILIVDDKPEEVELLKIYLAEKGYQVTLIEDGPKALVYIIEEKPDIVLLDIRLEGLTGIQICKAIKAGAFTTDIPIILLTYLDDNDSKIEGFEAGASDYIVKPFYPPEVLARLRVHLELSRKIIKRNVSDYSTLIAKALSLFMGENGHKLTVPDVAEALNISESTLRRSFAKEFNMSLMNYIRETRFNWAKRALKDTNLRIGAVAYEIGYNSAGDFSTAFKKRFGVTPRDYRNAA